MYSEPITTFIIPTIGRPTFSRALRSAYENRSSEVASMRDYDRVGEAAIRNFLIRGAHTSWVSMLDDDDTVTSDYVPRLEQEIEVNPDADVVIFRQYFLQEDKLIPMEPVIEWGNIGISFSVKTEVAREHPFVEQPHEDLEFIKVLAGAGKKIVFSKYITYRVRH